MSNVDEPYGLMKSYSAALETFGSDLNGIRGSKEERLFVTNPILKKIPLVYSHLNESVTDKFCLQTIFDKMGHSWNLLAGSTENEEKNQFRRNALKAYTISLELMEDKSNVEQYGMCLYKIARSYHLLEMNEEAQEYLTRFIQLFSDSSGSYDIKEYLCRAYIRVGQMLKEIGKLDNALEHYEKAFTLSNMLVNDCECITYLDTLAWSERVISYYFEDVNDIVQAIQYREKSLNTAQHVIEMCPKREYEEYRYRSLCKLGELYEIAQRYTDSLRVCEEAVRLVDLGFTDKQEELLERLVRVCGLLGKINKERMYQRLLNNKKSGDESLKRACSEIMAVLKYMDDELVKRVPETFIAFLKENSASDYVAAINPKEELTNQISEEAKDLIALIGSSYWDFGKDTTDKYNSNEEEYRLKNWRELKYKMCELPGHLITIDYIIDKKLESAFCDVYKILESFPAKIKKSISIEKVMWIKNNRGMASTPDGDINIDELSIETLALLKYVLGDLVYLN